jgi:hypothetical protein
LERKEQIQRKTVIAMHCNLTRIMMVIMGHVAPVIGSFDQNQLMQEAFQPTSGSIGLLPRCGDPIHGSLSETRMLPVGC